MNGPTAELHAAANIVSGPWAPSLSALLAAHAENATGTDEAALTPETAAALRLARDIRGTTTEDVPQFTGKDVKQVNDLLRTVITNLVTTLEGELRRTQEAR